MNECAVDFKSTCFIINVNSTCTTDTTLTHTACNNRSMTGHASSCRKNALGSTHTCEVFGTCFNAHHDYLMSVIMPFLCIISKENNLTTSGTRTCRKTSCQHLGSCLCLLIKDRVEQFIQFVWLTTQQGCLFIYLAFAQQVHGNLHHCRACTFSVTGLEEPQMTFLNGELHILHIVIVSFQLLLDIVQLLEDFRHSLFHRRIF